LINEVKSAAGSSKDVEGGEKRSKALQKYVIGLSRFSAELITTINSIGVSVSKNGLDFVEKSVRAYSAPKTAVTPKPATASTISLLSLLHS
jgi:hypothetical protein